MEQKNLLGYKVQNPAGYEVKTYHGYGVQNLVGLWSTKTCQVSKSKKLNMVMEVKNLLGYGVKKINMVMEFKNLLWRIQTGK